MLEKPGTVEVFWQTFICLRKRSWIYPGGWLDISGGKKEPWERCGGGGRAGQATGRWKVLTIDVRASRGCCEYFDSYKY